MERRDLAAELDALEEALGMRELATQEDEDETANEEEERELNDQLLGLIEKGVLDPEAVFGRNYGYVYSFTLSFLLSSTTKTKLLVSKRQTTFRLFIYISVKIRLIISCKYSAVHSH